MKRISLLTLAAAIASGLTQLLPADTEPGILWDRSRFEAKYADVYAAAFNGSDLIVTVGAGGVIRTSGDDGLTWDTPDPDVHYDLEDVIWDGTRFIAVGGFDFEHGIVLTSPDGSTWNRICLGSSQQLCSVCSSGSVIVAMGNNGRCFTTADTTSWSHSPSGITDDYADCAWTGSQFVRVGRRWVGGDLYGLIETSPDGTTWTPQRSVADEVIEAIVWSGSLLVAVGEDEVTDTSLVLTSDDGVAWTKLDMSLLPASRLRDVAWTGSRFVACGMGNVILTSPNATDLSWTSHSTGHGSLIHGLLWTGPGGHLFALSDDGLILKTSEAAPDDPGDWSVSADREDQPTFRDFAQHSSNPRIIVVGTGAFIAYSDDDGINGTDVSVGITGNLTGITATDLTSKRFIAVSDNGEVISSSAASNGGAWDFEGTLSGSPLNDVTWAEFATPLVLAVAANGSLVVGYESTPSWVWASDSIPGAAGVTFHGITYGKTTSGNLVVAVGSGGAIFTSPDGANWTSPTSGTSNTLYDVAPADIDEGGFMAVGSSGTVLVSKDGINWDSTSIDVDPLLAATYTGSQCVVVGWNGSIFTSPDAASWTQRYGETNESLRAVIASTTGRLLAGGTNGVVMYSDPAPDFADWMVAQPPTSMDDPGDDPNGDGIDNLASYALGIPAVDPPTADDLLRLLKMASSAPGQPVRVRLGVNDSNLPDVIYTLLESQTLAPGSWTETYRHYPGQECGSGPAHILPEPDGFAEIEIPADTIGALPKKFYRLGFTLTP